MFDAITDALKAKEEVRLVGFGTFVAAVRKASTGRNPRTGEEMANPRIDHSPFQGWQGSEGSGGICGDSHSFGRVYVYLTD